MGLSVVTLTIFGRRATITPEDHVVGLFACASGYCTVTAATPDEVAGQVAAGGVNVEPLLNRVFRHPLGRLSLAAWRLSA